MSYADYTVTLESGETWTLRMDTAEASAPVYHMDDAGEQHSTQYQTADSSHCESRMAEMLQRGWDPEDAVDCLDAVVP